MRNALRCLALTALLALSYNSESLAAASVVADPDARIFAYQTAESTAQADADALKRCGEAGAAQCQVIVNCSDTGHGAVAFDEGSGTFFAICGADSADGATTQVLQACQSDAANAGACKIMAQFDDSQAVGVDAAYFAGRWSKNCSTEDWYQFRFVSAYNFQMQSCSNKANPSCSTLKPVYGRGANDSRYIFPTTGHRLVKRDDNTLEWSRVDTTFLRRCP